MHSRSKRADTIALLDSGATENFMSLQYAKYLHLPIKVLKEPRKLFNVDGTQNRAGDLKYYTDLTTQTGTQRRTLRYFLSDLGENKVILGYLLLPEHAVKLLRPGKHCGCAPDWFCLPHDACFVHESCFCEGSGAFPPRKPPRDWVVFSRQWLAELLRSRSV